LQVGKTRLWNSGSKNSKLFYIVNKSAKTHGLCSTVLGAQTDKPGAQRLNILGKPDGLPLVATSSPFQILFTLPSAEALYDPNINRPFAMAYLVEIISRYRRSFESHLL
jgi:hypothetical protein